jgi:phosphatidylinositol glycan class B
MKLVAVLFDRDHRYLFLGCILMILAAWRTEGYFHPDEHFQLLEFANWKYGGTPGVALPWEFGEQMRPALQPAMAYGWIKIWHGLGAENPFILAFLMRLVSGGLFLWALWRVSRVLPVSTRPYFEMGSLLLWFMPMLSVRFSSENYAAITLLLACASLLGRSGVVQAGWWLGLSFCFRYQMAFAIIGVMAWLLYQRRTKDLFILGIAMLPALVLGILVDRWFYGEWVLAPWNYFRSNLLEGKAATFGVEPFWWYIPEMLLKAVPPLSFALWLGLGMGIRQQRGHLLTWVFLAFVIGHSLIGHKELRFLFPILVPFIWLAVQGFSTDIYPDIQTYRWCKPVKKLLLFTNFSLLAYATITPLTPSTALFRFLWDYPRLNQVEVCAHEADPYKWVGVDVYFYRPPGLEVEVVVIEDSCAHRLFPGDLLLTKKPLAATDTLVPVFSPLPSWIKPLNFNHWQERSGLWGGYRVR